MAPGADNRVVGSTRFWKIDRGNRKLEIGHTWLSASVQRSGVNTEAKFLLLRHAFDAFGAPIGKAEPQIDMDDALTPAGQLVEQPAQAIAETGSDAIGKDCEEFQQCQGGRDAGAA